MPSWSVQSTLGRRCLVALCLSWTGLLGPAAAADAGGKATPRVIRVVSDENYPPYLFRDSDGTLAGYLVDYWTLWEQKTGIQVSLAATRWAEAQRRVLDGQADVIDMIYRTAPREPLYDFSPPYAELPVDIFSHVSLSGISSVATLKGFQVGVQEGDACIEKLAESGITTLVRYNNYADLITGAMRAEVKVFCLDEVPATFYLYKLGAENDFKKAFELYAGQFHRAVRKGNVDTLALVVRGMQAITPEEDAKLRQKWFGTPFEQGAGLHWRDIGLAAVSLAGILTLLLSWLWTMRLAVKRKTMELAEESARLSDSEERFRALFEDTRQAITLVEGGRFVAANRAALDMLRLERQEDFLGQQPDAISPLVQPDGKPSAEKAAEMIGIAREKGFHQFEWEHVRADGEHFTALVMLTAIRQGGKELLHVVWSDITEQKKSERELAEHRNNLERMVAERTAELARMADTLRSANTQLQAILDAASAGILLIRHRVIEQCNRRLEEIAGYGPGELNQQPTRLLYTDDSSWENHGQKFYQHIADGLTYWAELPLQRKDGSQVWVRLSARAIATGDASQGIVCMVEDITEQRQAAEALRQANEKQRAIFDATPVGLVYQRGGMLESVNRRFTELFGYGQDEIPTIDAWWRMAYPDPGYRQWVQETWTAAVDQAKNANGKVKNQEYRVRCKGGEELSLLIGGQLVDDGLIATFTDVSSLKQAEATLKLAKEAAEDAARTKADFLANMSHEIRTPMNAVMGMTQLALKADPSPKVRDYLQKIQSSSQLLLGVINDILDFSKIEARKMSIDHVGFELGRMLDDVAALISEQAARKGLELLISTAADVPSSLVGDPLRLQQVLVNLASNAVKFTEQGEVSIRVTLQQRRDDEVELRFAVRDTGIGISDEQRDKLFQSFHQADSSTTRKFGGTGLGLAIAKRLSELMGGQIGMDSVAGQGSTFWFTARLGLDTDHPGPLIQPDLRGLKVLLVDDNGPAREVIGEILHGLGFVHSTAASGAEALDALEQADASHQPFDIVFLDWKMPGMDGIALAQEIRRRPLAQAPLVLMVTAYERDRVLSLAQQAGIREVLAKPLTPSALFDAVMRQFGSKPLPAGLAAAPADTLHELAELAGARALLVEDNELNQEVATEFLTSLGLEVDLAPDGAVALQKVQGGSYDVVLMDMQMPVMDGLTATREIRKLPACADLPILAMTANAMAGDRERCLEAGMNDHIAKPIDATELVTKLQRWVRPAPGRSRPAARMSPLLPAPATETAWISQLAGVAGLDARLGLRQVMGRETLYQDLLLKFVANQRDTGQRIAQAVEAGHWDEAQRLAHTLKGVAAQIGAQPLSQQAGQIETALRDRVPAAAIVPLLAGIANTLPTLVAGIAARLPQAAAQETDTVFDREQWRQLRQRLRVLLQQDDTACVELLERSRGLASAALGERFDAFSDAIGNFDFAAALAVLEGAP